MSKPRSASPPKAMRWYVFRLILALPWLLLLPLAFSMYRDIERINHTVQSHHHAKVAKCIENKKKPPEPEDFDLSAISRVPPLSRSDINIFVFGGSSVVFTTGQTFSQHLQARLRLAGHRAVITNFGHPGIDSHFVRRQALAVLDAAKVKPELVILYMGHNDFINTYHNAVVRPYWSLLPLCRVVYALTNTERHTINSFEGYMRVVMPVIVKALQQVGLVTVHDESPRSYDKLILETFMSNLDHMVAAAHRHGALTLVLTPVGNLRKEPYGSIHTVTAPYQAGLAAKDYHQALRYLEQARDAELLTNDIRAKTPMVQALRRYAAPGAVAVDLETNLKERHFSFGDEDFEDYLHMRDSTHELIADILFKVMTQDKRIAARLTPPGKKRAPQSHDLKRALDARP